MPESESSSEKKYYFCGNQKYVPIKAKKSFGQHFLKDQYIAEKIVESLEYKEGGNTLEIGPGKGVLTDMLRQKPGNLKLIEADIDMVNFLNKRYPGMGDDIIHFDFLKADLKKVFDDQPMNIIGNFPYNISSQIIFRILKYDYLVPEMVGMFQWEVAERIVSGPGSKQYGIISVLTQAVYDGELLFKVGRNAFDPPPKVTSGVIRLKRKENIREDYNASLFKHIVKTSFNQRRKMLRNTLKSLIEKTNYNNEELLMKRPEQLGVDEFIELTKHLDHESGD